MYSFSKIQLSAEIAQAIVTHHFGTQRKVKVYEELKDGFYNAAALLELDHGFRCVLKAAPPEEVRVLRYEKDIMRAEVESMRLVRKLTDVPVAEVYCYDTSRRLLPSEFFIMQFLPGVPLNKVRDQLSPEAQENIGMGVGRMIRTMSEITNPAFGYWAQPCAPGVLWRECFDGMVKWVMQDGLDLDVKLPRPYEEIAGLMAQHYDALDEVTTPRLVHWDLWDGNVFVDPQSGQITGLIDFERALWADPLMEAMFGDTDPDSSYARGYGGAFLTDNEIRRRVLYNAYLFLIMIIEVFYRHYDNDWQINWSTDRMKETLERLEHFQK